VKIRCPKCRTLGLDTDCTERMIHDHKDKSMILGENDDYELEVTLTFAVPVTSSLTADPHQMATHMRETWINEETQLQDVLAECVFGDYDLQVRPVFVA
jgi:hypothetical protein